MISKICPICNALFDEDTISVKGYIQCKNCNAFTRESIPSREHMRTKTSKVMLGACRIKDKEDERLKVADRQLDIIETYCLPGKVFDVGAAGGFFMKRARDRNWEVSGNELSSSAIKWAKAHYGIDIKCGFLDELDVQKNYFDVVVLWNTLEHVLNPRDTMILCRGMLKQGGIVLIEVPVKTKADLITNIEKPHITEFNENALDILLTSIGFAKLYSYHVETKAHPDIDVVYRKLP